MSLNDHALYRTQRVQLPTEALGASRGFYKFDLRALLDQFNGRPASLVGMYFSGSLNVTAAGGVAYPLSYDHLRAIQGLRLNVGGHDFFENVTLLDLMRDGFQRTGQIGAAADFTDLNTAGTFSIPLSFLYRFDNPCAPDERRNDDAIPVELLRHPDTVFGFEVSASLPGARRFDPATYNRPDVTVNGFDNLAVHFVFVHRDDLVFPCQWKVKAETIAEPDAYIAPKGGIEWLTAEAIKATGQGTVDTFNAVSLDLDGERVFTRETPANIESADLASFFGDPTRLSYITIALSDSDNEATAGALHLISAHSGARRTKLTRGRIHVDTSPRDADVLRVRYVYRDAGSRDGNTLARWEELTGTQGAPHVPKSAQGGGASASPRLPTRVISPTSRYRVSRERAASKLNGRGRGR